MRYRFDKHAIFRSMRIEGNSYGFDQVELFPVTLTAVKGLHFTLRSILRHICSAQSANGSVMVKLLVVLILKNIQNDNEH